VLCRHMKIRLDWVAENAANELLSLTGMGVHAGSERRGFDFRLSAKHTVYRLTSGWVY